MRQFKNNHEAFRFYRTKQAEHFKKQEYTKIKELRAANAGFLENYILQLEKRVERMNRTITRERARMRRLKKSRTTIEVEHTDELGQRHKESFIVLSKVHKIEKP